MIPYRSHKPDLSHTPDSSRRLIAIFSLAIYLLLAGCTHGLPVTPSSSGDEGIRPAAEHDFDNGTSDNRAMWGLWQIEIDRDSLTVEVVSGRSISAHWNVTELVRAPTCPGCIAFTLPHMVTSDILSVTATLTHPYAGNPNLDAFDVRGIVYGPAVSAFASGTVSNLINNPDGYCARWSHNPWAKINPYNTFAQDDPVRRFESGSTHRLEFLVNLPDSGKLTFDFAVDACWLPPRLVDPGNPALSPHCNEAVDAGYIVSGPINAHPGSLSLLKISFKDWQADGDKADVTIEIPALSSEPVRATLRDGGSDATFLCAIENDLHAAPGTYDALGIIRDTLNEPSTDALTSFTTARIVVTDTAPEITGLVIWPDVVALDDKGSTAQFESIAKLSDGGLARIDHDVKWTIDGSDLNGSTLAEIYESGLARRLTSKWWGGTATVKASYAGFDAGSSAICSDPFADSVTVDFGVFCQDGGTYTDKKKILGPPRGGGIIGGGTDVCALGYGGVATLEFRNNIIVDGPDADFIVFENAFYSGGCDWSTVWQNVSWCETAIVEVSQDGVNWFGFPSDYNPSNITCGIEPWANPASFQNIAGVHPVIASVAPDGTLANGIDPTDPSSAGGDAFDLAEVGLDWCRYVRLIDTGDNVDAPGTGQYDTGGDLILDFGKESPLGAQPGQAGFDCDSVSAVHSSDPLSFNK